MNIIELSRAAWNASRLDHQPHYDELIDGYRIRLHACAEAVIATGVVTNAGFVRFENEVKSQVAKVESGTPQPAPALAPSPAAAPKVLAPKEPAEPEPPKAKKRNSKKKAK